MKKIIFIFLLSLTLNPSFSYGKMNVSGRVLDERRFPISGIQVTINNSPTLTDKDGKFTVSDVQTPYSAVISDLSSSTTVIYDVLTISDPELILFRNDENRQSGKNVNIANVDVLIDTIPNNARGILKFISQNVSYSQEVQVYSGDSKRQLTVSWPAGEKSINGNIVYLEKNGQKFTRYAERNITLYNNEVFPQSIKIGILNSYESLNLSLLTVYLPSGAYDNKQFSVWGEFLGYDRNSQIPLIFQEANIQSSDTYVPSLLPFAFKLKVKAECFNSKGDGFINYTYTYPGSTVNLAFEIPPVIISPSNDFKLVDNSTKFSYQEGSNAGVYVVRFTSLYPEWTTFIVTKQREVGLPGGAGNNSNLNFNWNVQKYIPYFSVDDFAKPKLFNNEYTYKAISFSKTYTFKTR
ncbi:hypothetical protein BH10BAC5_BH10BAC5_18360 [soil metagenome]